MWAPIIAALRYIGQLLVVEFVGKLTSFLKEQYEKRKKQEANKNEAEKSVEPLKKAQTADEIDKASDDALDGF